MRIEAQYNSDLYDDLTVRRWLGMYESLLRAVVRDPVQPIDRLDVLTAAEAAALTALQPAPTALEGAPLMHAGFVARAAQQPDRPALRDGSRRMTYRELDGQSNRLARALRERGVGRGQRVGLCLDRGTDMFVALLAVLKSGAAYVPLDPAFPQARLDYYAEDASLALLLTASTIAAAPAAWCEDAAARVFRIDTDTAWRDAETGPLEAGPQDPQPEDTGLRHLHLGLDRQAQGRVRAAPRRRQPDGDDAARAGHRARRTGWPRSPPCPSTWRCPR